MPTHFLTPYFLDQPIDLTVEEDYDLNAPSLPDGAPVLERLVALYEPLAEAIQLAVGYGLCPTSIAGDCIAALGVLAGLQRAGVAPTLIWFDAHGDFNTPLTTPSGFLGGMPLAMAVGRGDQTIVRGLGLQPLPESQVILTDARDLDPGEREAVAASALTHLPRVTDLLEAPLPGGPLYVHFDCDVLDPAAVPAVNYPAPGGPSPGDLRRVFRRLAESEQLVAVSLSTWDPELDQDGQSRQAVLALLDDLLGEQP